MKTLKELNEICLDAYTEADVSEFKSLLGKDSAAIFVYNKNMSKLPYGKRVFKR